MKFHIRTLFFCLVPLVDQCACASPSTGPDPGETYNYVLGTQTFGSKYQFTDKPRLEETAGEILAMGSNILKFRFGPRFAENNYAGPDPGDYGSLVELAQEEPTMRRVFDMPFFYYFMWIDPFSECSWLDEDGYTEADAEAEYREIYDLTQYLLTEFNGSGKAFYFGNWEGDWLLHRGTDRTKDPLPEDIRNMIKWQANRQQAVDDAKRDTAYQDVAVYHYLEVVLVEKGIRGRPCVTTEVLPHVPVDFVSYSAYEMQQDYNLPGAMDRVLGFIEQQLQEKPGIMGKRVFIGEFGKQGATVGPNEQNRHAVEFIKAAMEWGCPFILQWELYCNEIEDGRHRGFWLIDDQGHKWPVYQTFKSYFQKARAFVSSQLVADGKVPSRDAFLEKAPQWVRTVGGRCRVPDVAPAEVRDFESGDLAGWRTAGDSVEVSRAEPFSGQYHLKLASAGQPEGWAVASWVKPASERETWHAEIKAACRKGILAKLKLAFYDADNKLLRQVSRTSVEADYATMTMDALAPEGTTTVHLVAAVETATESDPALGYFDEALLQRIDDN